MLLNRRLYSPSSRPARSGSSQHHSAKRSCSALALSWAAAVSTALTTRAAVVELVGDRDRALLEHGLGDLAPRSCGSVPHSLDASSVSRRGADRPHVGAGMLDLHRAVVEDLGQERLVVLGG